MAGACADDRSCREQEIDRADDAYQDSKQLIDCGASWGFNYEFCSVACRQKPEPAAMVPAGCVHSEVVEFEGVLGYCYIGPQNVVWEACNGPSACTVED